MANLQSGVEGIIPSISAGHSIIFSLLSLFSPKRFFSSSSPASSSTTSPLGLAVGNRRALAWPSAQTSAGRGAFVGILVGAQVGVFVGELVGLRVGAVGEDDGVKVGLEDGAALGDGDGRSVGAADIVGNAEGLGLTVGANVGAIDAIPH